MIQKEVEEGGRALVLVDQKELITQAVEKINDLGLPCEVERAEYFASNTSPIVVATVQTISGRLKGWPTNHFTMIICDEADKSISASCQKVLQHFTASKVAGFTATPNRTDKKSLGVYYEKIAYEISLFELVEQGYLSRIVIKQLPIKIDLSAVSQTKGDFDANELNDAITPHLQEAAKAIQQYASFRKILVFVPLIATSLKFVEICKQAGIAAEHIDGTSDDRTEKLQRYERGEFDVLVNSQLLARGVDIPNIDCVVNLAPTKSVTLYTQRIGRGTRLHDHKENLLLLDFLYEADKNLVCRPACLIAKSDEESESITQAVADGASAVRGGGEQLTAFDLLGMASVAQAQRERALRLKLEEHQDRQSRFISAEQFALKHNCWTAANYSPVMPWEQQPVTSAQVKYLQDAGIDLQTVKGKGHAVQLLEIVSRTKKLELASPAAKNLMLKMHRLCAEIGIMSPEHATVGEQRRFFAALNKRRKEKCAS